MRLIDADVWISKLSNSIPTPNYHPDLGDAFQCMEAEQRGKDIYDLIMEIESQPTVCKWHEIKSREDLPKEKGYYLVALERYKNWETKEKCYETSFIFFRGKTTWATCNGNIKAWMELPEDFKSK